MFIFVLSYPVGSPVWHCQIAFMSYTFIIWLFAFSFLSRHSSFVFLVFWLLPLPAFELCKVFGFKLKCLFHFIKLFLLLICITVFYGFGLVSIICPKMNFVDPFHLQAVGQHIHAHEEQIFAHGTFQPRTFLWWNKCTLLHWVRSSLLPFY